MKEGITQEKIEKKKVSSCRGYLEVERELNEIYTPLSVAKEEIWKRWNDKNLRKKVDEFLAGDIPDFLKDEPRAYLAKHVASPNFNFFEYFKSVKEIGLKPILPEYRKDKFTSLNDDKYYIGKIYFLDGQGKNGGSKIKTKTLIDFNSFEGKRFEDITTKNGGGFIDFHHKMLDFVAPGICENIVDISDWIKRKGGTPERFYLNFLTLFVCNAVLFENFLKKKEEDRIFGREVVLPNFRKITDFFGVKPLIVPTVPVEEESDLHLWFYPGHIKNCLE